MTEVKIGLPPRSELLWTPDDIAVKVGVLAAGLDRQFADWHADQPPLLIGVMPEGFCFAADLARKLTCGPVNYDFLTFTNSSSGPQGHLISVGPYPDMEGRDVTFLHARVKSGMTIRHTTRNAKGRGAASVGHVALVYQPGQRVVAKPEMAALDAGGDWHLFGYGIPHSRVPGDLSYATLPGIYLQHPEPKVSLRRQ